MRLSKVLLSAFALTVALPAVLPANADTVVEKTYYTSAVPVTKKVTMYKTSYVPVTRKRVVYEKAMVPVRKKVTAYKTSYVPMKTRSYVKLASAPETTTTVERKVVTTRSTEFIPTTTFVTRPSTIFVRPAAALAPPVMLSPTVIRTAPMVTATSDILVPESSTVIVKEKHHRAKLSTLQPVIWY